MHLHGEDAKSVPDIVLHAGLMHHISKHADLMEKISEVNDDVLVVNSTFSKALQSFLEFDWDGPTEKALIPLTAVLPSGIFFACPR